MVATECWTLLPESGREQDDEKENAKQSTMRLRIRGKSIVLYGFVKDIGISLYMI